MCYSVVGNILSPNTGKHSLCVQLESTCVMYSNGASFACVCTQQTSGMTALHDLSTTPGIVTSTSTSSSSSVEPTEAPSELEQNSSQDELSPVAASVSPVTTQPSLNTEAVEEPDLPPKSGK